MEGTERRWRNLSEADDVTEAMEDQIRDCVEGWFGERETTMGTVEFIDRFCKDYGGSGDDPDDWDMDNYDSPAARKIMRVARAHRREMLS